MLKLVFFILFLLALYVLWRRVTKQKINNVFQQQQKEISQWVQSDADDLPEKSKQIQENIVIERQKNLVETPDSGDMDASPHTQQVAIESVVTVEEQQLFDEVAQDFFSQKIQIKDLSQAERIHQDILGKMPSKTQSQLGSFDFGEWSIFWHLDDQSLEYYVGRYGVFYAHVDREGVEHKAEFKDGY